MDIEEGILVEWTGSIDNGLLPLMAVEQVNKKKVRPVLDYRELNKFVACHTGDESVRKWRKTLGGGKVADLKARTFKLEWIRAYV